MLANERPSATPPLEPREPDRALHIDLRRLPRDWPPAFVLGQLNLVRAFGMARIPVVVAITDRADSIRHSRWVHGHCLVPGYRTRSEQERTLAVLLRAGERVCSHLGQRAPLFYGGDDRLELVLRFREALSTYFVLDLGNRIVTEQLVDKARFYALCAERGVLAPRTAPIERATVDLRFPVLVKPRSKARWSSLQRAFFGGGKARLYGSRNELVSDEGLWEHADAVITQEYIPGPDRRLYSFHGVADDRGHVLASFVGRKIRTYPSQAGESSFIELVQDPILTRRGKDVVSRLGVRGVFKVDFKRDERDDRDHVLEINPRLTLWAYLGAVSGVNLAAVAYDHMLGRPTCRTQAVPHRTDRRWMHLTRDFQAMRELQARGELGLGQWLSEVVSPRTLQDGLCWSDPLPWLSTTWRRVQGKLVR